ncbi:MAG: hypothetical protein A3B74_05015 [Candidatus Kerfeldbacteria bacterium RIFCSPHIGHO2_02_FULL_42_14]|uniref:S1 motif domain-containing protein n=1 Tax=Candidatus Kerfeldbacteria bacterium RIFCSPHIGHO2_02_FULL_42_14 TaxID=1798540 RepID=A0A1G2AVF3_9BACT|nr:MAG: hypothetical protein A3B74_05015 [Candidatus Kerfeldbacteria bacterium RIFCSPHIGHO2_02_FULL_42_14]OGY81369.1 MAG: hypothetical protein A3E60_01615 [Candidatus Kerfeldbacteria bacterium RIFCSPHIGHO2_12_FULL_42_13]OGY83244.1 MAG: hypothetical protein A3I91_03650 [Candidatus Kerfeldbacteria bacterium RIFCSPLOWO2_02_FULL_42_19]OGY85699.1 MAG: hypothetical protein A3G01_00040 [Candidatus Kerfeldbacteria bacterium RIFCSPLOWO2_12_FULL_43_9]
MLADALKIQEHNGTFAKLFSTVTVKIPKPGDVIQGRVLSASKSEVQLDIDGLTTGIIRGPELYDESGEQSNLRVGNVAEATVIDIENEKGIMELSFRFAGHAKAWKELEKLMREGRIVEAKIEEANKGGLLVKVGRVNGFLPVSQLTIEHYPRVEGGNRQRILERLQQYVGQAFKTKIIDVNEKENKLIVSERAAWEEKQQEALSGYKVGNVIEGKVSGVVDFGAFVEFGDGLEGLVHISELAWQRIENPRDIVKVGETIKATIIGIDRSKISLSMKKLIHDPWQKVGERYKIEQTVQGKVLKINPFGIFVELDPEIHGLAHISELSDKKISNPTEVVAIGKTFDFKIISMEPKHHRLGLSLKALKKSEVAPATTSTQKQTPTTALNTSTEDTEIKTELSTKQQEIKIESVTPDASKTAKS